MKKKLSDILVPIAELKLKLKFVGKGETNEVAFKKQKTRIKVNKARKQEIQKCKMR